MNDRIRAARCVLRRLALTPGFTLATLITLALGIGANTAVFSVVNSILLKPLPHLEPDRLIGLWQTAPGVKIKDLNASIADYITYREHSKTFTDVAIWNGQSVTVTQFSDPERVDGIGVTFRLLPMLGVHPVLGRQFTERDNQDGAPEVIMISYGYWQRRFGSDPKIIGRRLMADNIAGEIIGVLPKDFWFMDMGHDIVTPLRFNRSTVRLAGYNFSAIARLRPGVTVQRANADVARMIGVELKSFPPPEGMSRQMMDDARLGPNIRLLRDDLLGDTGKSLWVAMAAIGIVLLIACANVANLMLVRIEGRAQELAVRAALGAGRARIAREILAESLALALAGGCLGVAFAFAVVKLVLKLSPGRMPRFEQISVDPTALLFALAVSILAGVALAAIPVMQHGGIGVAESLRAGGRNASVSRERNLVRNILTVVQVGLALVLLIGSGLMIRTFQSIHRVHPGFTAPETLQTLRISVASAAAPNEVQLLQMQHHLVSKLASIPGVTEVSILGSLPMTDSKSQDPIFASDHAYAANQIPPLRRFISTAPGAFQVLGTPLLAGRGFTWSEIEDRRRVAIVSDNFARDYWGSARAAVGKQIRSNPKDPWSEVVGVVGDVRYDGVDKPAPTCVYWPMTAQNSIPFLIRTSRTGTMGLLTDVRRTLRTVSTAFPITEVWTMKQLYDKSMARTVLTLTLLAISGGMALLLAVVGIYAVISYTVSQRTREIGIRLALGAQQGNVKRIFVGKGLLWSGVGVLAGLAAAAVLSRLMSALLFGISPIDPLTYAAVGVGILAAAMVASYLAARRITRVDPVEALRAE